MSRFEPEPFPSDEQNPYAPPQSDLTPELVPLGAGVAKLEFSIGDVLSRSWEIYRERMGLCIGIVVGCNVINSLAQQGAQLAVAVAPQARNPMLIFGLTMVVAVVFQIWINIGQTLVMLAIARGQSASFSDVFSGGPYLWPVLIASLLWALVLLAVVALGALPGGIVWAALGRDSPVGPVLLGLGVAAGFVVATIVSLRFSQYYFLLIDRNDGIAQSFQDSLTITRGKAALIFVLYLLTGVINMGGLLACFIGMIFTIPFTMLLMAVTYLTLSGQAVADPLAKGEPLAELEPL